jgi:hypothetical protein
MSAIYRSTLPLLRTTRAIPQRPLSSLINPTTSRFSPSTQTLRGIATTAPSKEDASEILTESLLVPADETENISRIERLMRLFVHFPPSLPLPVMTITSEQGRQARCECWTELDTAENATAGSLGSRVDGAEGRAGGVEAATND